MSKTLTRRHEQTMYHEIPFRGHVRQRREKEFRATFSEELLMCFDKHTTGT